MRHGMMVVNMKETSKMAKRTVKELSNGQTRTSILGAGEPIKCMA